MTVFPTFSDVERDRRWRETRERMGAQGMDALVLLPAAMNRWGANQRYLSQVGGNNVQVALLFPLAGDPMVVIPSLDEAIHWKRIAWIDDLRGSEGGRYGKVLADRVKELKLQGGTIGTPYLQSAPQAMESPVPAGALEAFRTELPAARLVDATALLEQQRSIKSDEEIAMIERAASIAERGIGMLAYRVRVGMPQTEALGILEGAMVEAGCELGNQILWECSRKPGRTWRHPYHVPIERGDVIQSEVEARVAGYNAREVHPISMGKPQGQIQELFDLSTSLFTEAMALLKPGASVKSLSEFVGRAGEGAPYHVSLSSYGIGLAREDLTFPEGGGSADDATYQDRQVVVFKPVVRTADGLGISFGSTVVVTPEGGRRLGQRSMVMLGSHRSFLAPYLAPSSEELPPPWSPLPSRA